jgi:putative FmdB family regulatory protein
MIGSAVLSFAYMPTYEYRCPEGHVSEKFFRKISDAAAELPCPVCGATAERQLSGGAGLLFKGSGFYITDYGKDGKKKPVSGEKAEATGAGNATSESSGGESKSEGSAPAGERKPSAKGSSGTSGTSGASGE